MDSRGRRLLCELDKSGRRSSWGLVRMDDAEAAQRMLMSSVRQPGLARAVVVVRAPSFLVTSFRSGQVTALQQTQGAINPRSPHSWMPQAARGRTKRPN